MHIADIHLGCRQYHSKDRQRDFYLAFSSAVERFALPLEEGGAPQVDFVVLPGDLFDQRNLQPITLSRATDVLSRLRDAGIPVIASEGNHDAVRRHEPGEPNWYQFLCGEEFLIYLSDEIEDGQVHFAPWDEEARAGGYIDLPCGVRVVGTQWYGATAHAMLERVREGLAALPPAAFTILMFHGGLTDYVNVLSAGVEYEELLPLRPYVQYLALGHVHKKYERQGWVFNPGSLEACKLSEFFDENGAFRVTIGADGSCEAEHLTDYWRRPFLWLEIACDLYTTPAALQEAIRELILGQGMTQVQEVEAGWPEGVAWAPPICHLELRGALGFPFSQLEIDELEPWICETLGAWMFRYHNDTVPRELGAADALPMNAGRIDREALERRVFASLLADDTRYATQAEPLASWATELKQQLLADQVDELQRGAFADELVTILGEAEVEANTDNRDEPDAQASEEGEPDNTPTSAALPFGEEASAESTASADSTGQSDEDALPVEEAKEGLTLSEKRT